MAIDINTITNATATGIFDVLMNTSMLHIDKEVDANRITQGEAGLVYTAAIQSAMQSAIQFALEVDVKNKQLEVIEVERLSKVYEKDTLLVDKHNEAIKQLEKLTAEIKTINVVTVIKDKECATMGLDNVMKQAQIAKDTIEYVYTSKYTEG